MRESQIKITQTPEDIEKGKLFDFLVNELLMPCDKAYKLANYLIGRGIYVRHLEN